MKILFVLALSFVSVSSFAQYQPGTKGNPYPQNVQVVTVQPGSTTYIQALVPTQVFCQGAPAPSYPPAPIGKTVQFFHSDDCSTGFLSSVTLTGFGEQDEQLCRQKAAQTTVQVWGVKVNGQCTNITDMDLLNACIGQM